MGKAEELRERFGVHNGRLRDLYKYKNLNWYFSESPEAEEDQWFCFGDIYEDDIERLTGLLNEGEALVLGWKDLPAYEKEHDMFRNGGGRWLVLIKGGVFFDKDDRATWNCQNPKCPDNGGCGGQCAQDF